MNKVMCDNQSCKYRDKNGFCSREWIRIEHKVISASYENYNDVAQCMSEELNELPL